MRLVFLIDNGKVIGGGDYAQFKFAQSLAELGHHVTIFAANHNEFLDDFKEQKNLTIRIRKELPKFARGVGRVNKLWEEVYTKSMLERFLKKESAGIDYVIGYLRNSAIKAVRLGKKYNIKTVNFVFECPPWMEKDLGDRWLEEYKGKFKRNWAKTKKAYIDSDILIGNSKMSQKECQLWTGRKVAGFAYPGVDFSNADRIPEQKKRDQLIYIGRLNTYKNVDIIIKALSAIKKRPKLVIAGTGEEESNLRQLAKDLGVICSFVGSQSDSMKFKEMKRSIAMVFPSSHEGFGMPPSEALYCKIPCICSDKPIFKEIYENKVLYFKECDERDLARRIKDVMRGKYPSILIGKRFIRKYDWRSSARKIEKILQAYKA